MKGCVSFVIIWLFFFLAIMGVIISCENQKVINQLNQDLDNIEQNSVRNNHGRR
tara:strand:+ start:106 stop:267 length:162 start_codon:yes stop_codon:yes gene_type:complete